MGNIISLFLDQIEDGKRSDNTNIDNATEPSNDSGKTDISNDEDKNKDNVQPSAPNENDNKGVDGKIEPVDNDFIAINIDIVDTRLSDLQKQLNNMINKTGSSIIIEKENSILQLYRSICARCFSLIIDTYSDTMKEICNEMKDNLVITDINIFPSLIRKFIISSNEKKIDINTTLSSINSCFNSLVAFISAEIDNLKISIHQKNAIWNNTYGSNNSIYKTIQDTAASYKGLLNDFDTSFTYISNNYNSTEIPIIKIEEENPNLYLSYFAMYNDEIVLRQLHLNVTFPFSFSPLDILDEFVAPNGLTVRGNTKQITINENENPFLYNNLSADTLINQLGKYSRLTTLRNAMNAILKENDDELKLLQDTSVPVKISEALATANNIFSYFRDMDDDEYEILQIQELLIQYNRDLESFGKMKKEREYERIRRERYASEFRDRKTIYESNDAIYKTVALISYPKQFDSLEDLYKRYKQAYSDLPSVSIIPIFDIDNIEESDRTWNNYMSEWSNFNVYYTTYKSLQDEYVQKYADATGDYNRLYAQKRQEYIYQIENVFTPDISSWKQIQEKNIETAKCIEFDSDKLSNLLKSMIASYNLCFQDDNNYYIQYNNEVERLYASDDLDKLIAEYEYIEDIYDEITNKQIAASNDYKSFNSIAEALTEEKRRETIASNKSMVSNDITTLNNYSVTISSNTNTFDVNRKNANDFAKIYITATEVDAYVAWKQNYDILTSYTINLSVSTMISTAANKLNNLFLNVSDDENWRKEYESVNMSEIYTYYVEYEREWNQYVVFYNAYSSSENILMQSYQKYQDDIYLAFKMAKDAHDLDIITYDKNIALWKETSLSYSKLEKVNMEISNMIMNIKDNYETTFNTTYKDIYNEAVREYKNVTSNIETLEYKFSSVKSAYNAIDARQVNINKSISDVGNMITEFHKDEEENAKVNDWNDQFKEYIYPIILEKTSILNNYIIPVFNYRELSISIPEVQDLIAEMETNANIIRSSIQSIQDNISSASNTLNGFIITATRDNIVPSIEALKANVEAVDVNYIQNDINRVNDLINEIDEDRKNIFVTIANSNIDTNELREIYLQSIEDFKSILNEQIHYLSDLYDKTKYNYFNVYYQYCYLHNMIFNDNIVFSNTIQCDDVIISTDQTFSNIFEITTSDGTISLNNLWSDANRMWEDVKPYVDEEKDVYQQHISNITNYMNMSVNESDLCDVYRKLKQAENDMKMFEINDGTMESITMNFNSAYTYYENALGYINEAKDRLEKGDVSKASLNISDCQNYIVNIFYNWILSIAKEVNETKAFRIKYGNAARILAMVFGHNEVGLKRSDALFSFQIPGDKRYTQVQGTFEYIRYLLSLDVFKALCLYPPMQAIIWPDGASSIEEAIQRDTSYTDSDINKFYSTIGTYLSDQLPLYLTTGIIRTMDNDYPSPIVSYASNYAKRFKSESNMINEYQNDINHMKELVDRKYHYDEILTKLGQNETVEGHSSYDKFYNGDYFNLEMEIAELKYKIEDEKKVIEKGLDGSQIILNEYWLNFISSSLKIRNDNDFKVLCSRYLDVPGKHLYWKIFRTLSGKFNISDYSSILEKISLSSNTSRYKYTTSRYLETFPVLNPDAEKREAIIILMNRCFSYYGYVSSSDTNERLAWNEWMQRDIPINAGGQCIDYDDRDYYNTLSQGDSNKLSKGNRICTVGLKYLKKSTDFEKYYVGINTYMRFSNPTAEINFIFKTPAMQNDLSSLGIGNYLIGQTDINAAINNLIDSIMSAYKWPVVEDSVKTYSTQYASTDYISLPNENGQFLYEVVYDKIIRSQYDWKLCFAFSEDRKSQPYRITKINSYTYRKCKQMIYNIFSPDFIMDATYAKTGKATYDNSEVVKKKTV